MQKKVFWNSFVIIHVNQISAVLQHVHIRFC